MSDYTDKLADLPASDTEALIKATLIRDEKERIEDLRGKILVILDEYPQSRNSDLLLTHLIHIRFFAGYVRVNKQRNDCYVSFKDQYALPTVESVKRLRAVIQNKEKQFPPTEERIAKARGWKQEAWHEAMKEMGEEETQYF